MRSGIPTTYRGTNFRSRLEARWAAFFDLIGWAWVYEPLDADGYIPDFLIQGPHPLFVEVGPCVTEQDYREKAAKATENAAELRHDVLVVGVSPDLLWLGEFHGEYDCGGMECGYQVGDRCMCSPIADLVWGLGEWSTCTEDETETQRLHRDGRLARDKTGKWPVTGCYSLGVAHTEMSFRLRPCGHYPGGHIHPPKQDIRGLWAEAGNRVQWRRAT